MSLDAAPLAPPLLLRGGRVLDPGARRDEISDVLFQDGRVAAIGPGLAAPDGAEIRDAAGAIVTPGLIDLHAHVYWGGTSLGVDPAVYAAQSAVATIVDAGSAGPGNIAGFVAHVIAPAPVRILAYLHVSHAGIYAFSKRVMVGESADLRLMDPAGALAAAAAHREHVVGIKVRVGRLASGDQGMAPLEIALETAEAAGLPLMAHIDAPPPSYEAVLERLRPGDQLTHAFRPFPNTPVQNGQVKPAVRAARARGVLLDIGHGAGSFDFEVARAMLAAGEAPDVISSDVHALSAPGPAVDLLTTMTKFLALGLPLPEVIRAATAAPAAAIRRPMLGTLAVGGAAEASVLALEDRPIALCDTVGATLTAPQRLSAKGLVIGGRWREAGAPRT